MSHLRLLRPSNNPSPYLRRMRIRELRWYSIFRGPVLCVWVLMGVCVGKCIICGGQGISDAYYCANCTRLEKDRDGCPKIINLGSSRTDLFYEKRKLGQTGFVPGGGK